MNSENIKISVIIPVYNPDVSLLKEALGSVLCQTLGNIEILLIDDGSFDDYLKDLSEFLSNSKIKLIKSEKNQGSGNARNIGIKTAAGEYIAFLDADDKYFSDDVLEKLYSLAKANRVKVAGAKAMADYEGNVSQIIWSFKNYTELFKNRIADINKFQICYGFWCFIYQNKFIKQNNFYFNNLSRYQDPIWLYDILCKCKKFYCADLPFYFHREKNMVQFNWNKKTLSDYFKGITELSKKSLKNKHYDLHTFLYRKAIFWEYKIFLRAKSELNIDMEREFTNFLNSFNSDIIKKYEPKIPLIKSLEEFETTDMNNYKNFDY